MSGERKEAALTRIERALARIEAVAARPSVPARGIAALESRHAALRSSTRQALKELETLIAGGNS